MGMTREDYGKCGAEGTGVVIGQIDHDMIFIGAEGTGVVIGQIDHDMIFINVFFCFVMMMRLVTFNVSN